MSMGIFVVIAIVVVVVMLTLFASVLNRWSIKNLVDKLVDAYTKGTIIERLKQVDPTISKKDFELEDLQKAAERYKKVEDLARAKRQELEMKIEMMTGSPNGRDPAVISVRQASRKQ